jgi:hypothetical protein
VPEIPDQPDGIADDSRDLPNPIRAAERVREYVCATGDGLYDVQDGAPLYGRDLEAICRAIMAAAERVASETEDREAGQGDQPRTLLPGEVQDDQEAQR